MLPFLRCHALSKEIYNPLTIWLVMNLRRIIIKQIERSVDAGPMKNSPRINSIASDQSKALRADRRKSGMSRYVIRVPSIYFLIITASIMRYNIASNDPLPVTLNYKPSEAMLGARSGPTGFRSGCSIRRDHEYQRSLSLYRVDKLRSSNHAINQQVRLQRRVLRVNCILHG